MNAIKRNIPNIITLANLTCGLLSIIFAFQGNLKLAALCIFAGAFFDFFDGLAARLLKVNGELGKQFSELQLLTIYFFQNYLPYLSPYFQLTD